MSTIHNPSHRHFASAFERFAKLSFRPKVLFFPKRVWRLAWFAIDKENNESK
jgi:hypothetical protein